MGLVVPAVLPASRRDLDEKLALILRTLPADRIQIDAVDGKFAAPASWPYTAPAELREWTAQGGMLPALDRVAYEIDLMCLDAETAAEAWLSLGATRLILHAESSTDLPRLFAFLKDRYGTLVSLGLALNVASDLALIGPCLPDLQFVQFMGIAKIGRQGEPQDPRVYEKVRVFRERHPEVNVQVDGGVTLEAAKKLVQLGVTNLVVGSGLLKAADPAAAFAAFEALESPYGV